MQKYLTILTLLFFTTLLRAQTGRISGTIIDSKTGETLPGATILVEGTSRGASADFDGKFSINNVPAGKVTLVVSYISYTTKKIGGVVVTANDVTDINVLLEASSSADLQEVEVVVTLNKENNTALVLQQKNNASLSDGVSAETIRRTPDRTTSDVLKRISGVTIQDDKFVIIRGLNERYNASYLNGTPLPSTEPDKRAFAFDLFPANMLDNIVINKTATPDMPGEFAGGIVFVNTKSIPEKNFVSMSVGGGYNTITTGKDKITYNGGKLDKLGFDDGSRNMPSQIPAFKDKATWIGSGDQARVATYFKNDWAYSTSKFSPNTNFQLAAGYNFKRKEKDFLGVILRAAFISNIPHRLVGGTKFYERREVKDILFYLRFLLNPTENIAFLRIINTPARGIGKTTISKIESIAIQNQTSLVEAAAFAISQSLLPVATLKKISDFLTLMNDLKGELQNLLVSDIYKLILEKIHYVQRLKEAEEKKEADMRIGNLQELHNAIKYFEEEKKEGATLQAFLERTALINELEGSQEIQDYVTLMTLHVSKGLEFPYVFIVGMEEGLFPTASALDSFDSSNSLEEERRLAYVGMTRAKEKLYLTYAKERRTVSYKKGYPMPSRFLTEIPTEYIIMNAHKPYHSMKSSTYYGLNSNTVNKLPSYKKPNDYHKDDFDKMPDYESQVDEKKSISKGCRVRHSRFGVGTVYQTEGRGEGQRVTVLFEDNSIRKFITKHAGFEVL